MEIINHVFKILITILWVLFLVVGATTIQQIREMHEVLRSPVQRSIWIVYFIYVGVALLAFLISVVPLWF